LQDYARLLGSDCAFFLENGARLAVGKGDIFSPLPLRRQFTILKSAEQPATTYGIVIIKPSFSISTAEAYKSVTPNAGRPSLEKLLQLPVEQWRGNIENDFEKSLHEKYPQIEEIKNELYGQGALYASLSGSGSAIYGIFKRTPALSAIQTFKKCEIFYSNLKI
jgi:4-diphosphocytidyl-2-C-methyl-D-erythritol kinase